MISKDHSQIKMGAQEQEKKEAAELKKASVHKDLGLEMKRYLRVETIWFPSCIPCTSKGQKDRNFVLLQIFQSMT